MLTTINPPKMSSLIKQYSAEYHLFTSMTDWHLWHTTWKNVLLHILSTGRDQNSMLEV